MTKGFDCKSLILTHMIHAERTEYQVILKKNTSFQNCLESGLRKRNFG
jgi:hypothetical protein